MQVATTTRAPRKAEDRAYVDLVAHTRTAIVSGPLFTTDAAGLYDAFLDALPAERRSHYVCRSCRNFVDWFGGLVTLDESGAAASPLWSGWEVPAFFSASVKAMAKIVAKARVNGVFLSSDLVWGLPKNKSAKAAGGEWRHLHVASAAVHRPSALHSSAQVMAEKFEDHGILCRGLAEFPIALVKQAHTLLTSGALCRSEKCIGVVKWLLDLHGALEATKHKSERHNLIWRAVATAPPGFCHVRSTMISTLLEDLVAGKDFADIKRSFDAKMSPILYQRPQAAPTDGQIEAAERVISSLATARALERRFARLDEVLPHAIWVPKPAKEKAPTAGVFGHLKASARAPERVDVPPQTMTWDKFNWTILPNAERVELLVPSGPSSYFAFVTAEDPKAAPILQWDREDKRNPVSWYLYASGSPASAWGLSDGTFVDVDAVTLQPSGWTSDLAHQGDGAYFVLRGAHDMQPDRAGIGLFPEILKSEYHSIRSAIEAYSRSKSLGGLNEATACGIALQKMSHPNGWGHVFRVTAGGTRLSYRLDRWD